MTTTSTSWGPEFTPNLIRNLIILTCGISLVAALTEPLMGMLFGLPGLSYLFCLSWNAIQHYFLWQVGTYLFIEGTNGFGISLSFLIGLAFNMYLLWIMGSDLLTKIGKPAFLRFYLFSGIFAGCAALLAMYLTNVHAILSGPAPAILAILTAWTLFNAEQEMLFMLLFPIKAKWLWAFLAGAIVLISLSHLDWISLTFYGAGLLFGYVYSVMAWERKGPFAWTRWFDRTLAAIGRKVQMLPRMHIGRQPKIFDFKTGEPLLDDNRFVDAMLEKISKYGESSLTWKERQRLQSISKNKQKK